jgi:hypothetical protein
LVKSLLAALKQYKIDNKQQTGILAIVIILGRPVAGIRYPPAVLIQFKQYINIVICRKTNKRSCTVLIIF